MHMHRGFCFVLFTTLFFDNPLTAILLFRSGRAPMMTH